jgi:hypothetical protein
MVGAKEVEPAWTVLDYNYNFEMLKLNRFVLVII